MRPDPLGLRSYDPFGRRIEKRVVDVLGGSTVTRTVGYVYDGEDIVLQKEEVVEGGATTTVESRFVHGPRIDEPLALVRGGQSYFYHADGLGSVVAITDAGQGVVQRYGYESFGLPAPQNTTFSQPYAFTGREWDSEVGLYYYRARYYDPLEGRFISKDPIGFGGGDVNVYRYVQNDPINWIDPVGLFNRVPGVPDGLFMPMPEYPQQLFYDNTRYQLELFTQARIKYLVHKNEDLINESKVYSRLEAAYRRMAEPFGYIKCDGGFPTDPYMAYLYLWEIGLGIHLDSTAGFYMALRRLNKKRIRENEYEINRLKKILMPNLGF